jgi:hypothetical protein
MTVSTCPVCESADFEEFHHRADVPVLCNVLCRSADEAREVPRGDVRLVVCARCSMIWNQDFAADALDYSGAYENSLHFSPEFQRFVSALAQSLSDRVPRGATIVELGCGQGDFLELVCARPDLRGLGVDPGYRGPVDASARVRYLAGSWDAAGSDVQAALVCARHVLEHLSRPADLFDAAASLLDGPTAMAYIEVPDAGYMLDRIALWDVVYEHPLYFVDRSLRRLAERTGFVVTSSGTGFGGQYLWIECRRGGGRSATGDGEAVVESARAFDRRAREVIAWYEAALHDAAQAGQRIALWGTGSKGTTFLNLVEGAAAIDAVVDVNPRKVGLFVPGTGQPVIDPAQLQGSGVDKVIVLNPNYRTEISARLVELAVDAAVLTPS